jgi:hypothetical protein
MFETIARAQMFVKYPDKHGMKRSMNDNEGLTPPRHVEIFADFARAFGAFLFARIEAGHIARHVENEVEGIRFSSEN